MPSCTPDSAGRSDLSKALGIILVLTFLSVLLVGTRADAANSAAMRPEAAGNGHVCREFVEFVDLIPTLGELLGFPVPSNLEGVSFAPLLSKPDSSWKSAVFQVQSPDEQVVRNKRFSYMEFGKGPVPAALYDLQRDPWETRNLATDPAYAKTRIEMAALLKAGWRSALPSTAN